MVKTARTRTNSARALVLGLAAVTGAAASTVSGQAIQFSDRAQVVGAGAVASHATELATTSTPDFRALVTQLGSEDLAIREAATETILSDPRISLDAIEQTLTDPSLTLEQRSRLESIGTERFSITPRAALGVTFESRMERFVDGVPITDTTRGFDSHRVLERGDIIHTMSGKRVRSFEDARRIITSHDPGDRVTLKVLRAGQPLLVRVSLGSYDDLMRQDNARAQSRPRAVLMDAWRLRIERRGQLPQATSPVIEPGIELGDYEVLNQAVDAATAERFAAAEPSFDAGRPRSASGTEESGRLDPAGGSSVIDLASCTDYAAAIRQSSGGDIAVLEMKQQELLQEYRRLDLMLRDPNRPQAERLAMSGRLADMRNQLAILQAQIRAARVRQGQVGKNHLEP